MTTLAEQYGNIQQTLAAGRSTGREWLALGGGTGFLKYHVWPGDQGSTITGDRLLSRANFPFGVEYAKKIKGSITKIAECGRQDAASGTDALTPG